jgi:ABC-type nitrate/sulfonate/bicarbonate transport system ATPase subunit
MLSFDRVDFGYPQQTALVLGQFSLALPERGVVCLVGPSGCGKTTALRLLAGLESPLAGTLKGRSGLRVSMVFQEDRLLPWESVLDNAITDRQPWHRTQALSWLQALGLGDHLDARVVDLSGGMRRRVAIARALAAPHDVLLLDEPFTGLDEPTWRDAAERIAAASRHRLVVMTTHLIQQAEAMGAEVIALIPVPLRAAEE